MSHTDEIQSPTSLCRVKDNALALFSGLSFESKFVFSLYENSSTTLPLHELAARAGAYSDSGFHLLRNLLFEVYKPEIRSKDETCY